MFAQSLVLQHPLRIGLSIGALVACSGVVAAPRVDDRAAIARYRQERAVCLSDRSNQDRPTCLREASAALADARRGSLVDGATTYTINALKRCEPLPDAQRTACEARMHGAGSTHGDAAAGGIYRELVTPDSAEPTR